MHFFGGLTNHRIGATLAFADGIKHRQLIRCNRHHIAFLGFITPNGQRRHTGLIVWNGAQFKFTATAAVFHQLRHGITQATGTHIVNKTNRVFIIQLPALIDHLLTTTLHLRVIALYRGKIQIFGAGTGGHGGSSPATQTNQHGRATQHDQLGTHRNSTFVHVIGFDVAVTTGNHNGLVVTANLFAVYRGNFLFVSSEITVDVRAAEFVIKTSTTQGAFDHKLQRRHNAAGLAIGLLPGLFKTGDIQVGNGKAG